MVIIGFLKTTTKVGNRLSSHDNIVIWEGKNLNRAKNSPYFTASYTVTLYRVTGVWHQ